MKPMGVVPEVKIEGLVSNYLAMSPDVQVKFLKFLELIKHGDLVTKNAAKKFNNGRLAHNQFWLMIENQYRLFEQGKATSDPNN